MEMVSTKDQILEVALNLFSVRNMDHQRLYIFSIVVKFSQQKLTNGSKGNAMSVVLDFISSALLWIGIGLCVAFSIVKMKAEMS